MAPQKKKAPKKVAAQKKPAPKKKRAVKKLAARKKAAPGKKAPARKKPATRRRPPMHATVSHPELSEGETERDETFEIFKTFDRDGSGSIDRAELSRLLEALGQELPDEELAVALEVIDVNHSGRISWEEFSAWWSAR